MDRGEGIFSRISAGHAGYGDGSRMARLHTNPRISLVSFRTMEGEETFPVESIRNFTTTFPDPAGKTSESIKWRSRCITSNAN